MVDDAMALEVVALCFAGQNLLCSVKDRLVLEMSKWEESNIHV